MTDEELHDAEQLAYWGRLQEHELLRKAVAEIRSLRHQLADPNYIFACSRIGRGAILYREARNEHLRKENEHLRKELDELKLTTGR